MNTVRINGQDYTSSLSDTEIAFMGNLSLPTTAQTLSGAIAEHETDISELNSNLTPEVFNMVSAGNVTIEYQKCYKIGKIAVLKITAKTNQAISNTTILNFPSNIIPAQEGSIFLSGQGSRWSISNIAYTYITGNGIVTRDLSADTYIHIDTVLVLS